MKLDVMIELARLATALRLKDTAIFAVEETWDSILQTESPPELKAQLFAGLMKSIVSSDEEAEKGLARSESVPE